MQRRLRHRAGTAVCLPEGQLYHVAGPSADGWTIIAVHDSQESWERFRDEILMPRMTQGIDGGFSSPPEETGVTRRPLLVIEMS